MGKPKLTRLSSLPRLFEGQYEVTVPPCSCAAPSGLIGDFCRVCGNAIPTAEELVMVEHQKAVLAAKAEALAKKRPMKRNWCSVCHQRAIVEVDGRHYCGPCCSKKMNTRKRA